MPNTLLEWKITCNRSARVLVVSHLVFGEELAERMSRSRRRKQRKRKLEKPKAKKREERNRRRPVERTASFE